MDDEVIVDREIAAVVGLVLGLVAIIVGIATQLVAVALPLGAIGFGLGLWAAARGERAVIATLAVFIGLAAVTSSIVWVLTVN